VKRKRLKRGRDWHAWAWLAKGDEWRRGGTDGFMHFAEPQKVRPHPTERGQWVRVKFVPVVRP
jgi:hypothetical protein